MLAIAQAAVLFGIKQSQIFQIVEMGAAHFNEAEAGAIDDLTEFVIGSFRS